jgi:nitrogen fixation protein NifU and related proteins
VTSPPGSSSPPGASSPPTGAAALYHATILDRDRHPRHHGPLADATHEATLDNPLCGDVVTLRLIVEPGEPTPRILAATFEGRGCAVSRASASLWAELLHARAPVAPSEIAALIDRFARFVAEPPDAPLPDELGELVVLGGVRAVKSRRLCATLASRALAAALAAPSKPR